MYAINARNVAEALPRGLELLLDHGRREESRAGPVIVMDAPVTTIYQRPRERVLFSAVRDANPFFHIYEALWMLAGRRDAEPLTRFVSDFATRFAEPDGTIHDAYGYRWRRMLGHDQLQAVVQQLTEKPESRQAVIQMWDATPHGNPLASPDGMNDLLGDWRTRPCNTHAYLRVRNEDGKVEHATAASGGEKPQYPRQTPVLDITVCCRSNDVVMGAYGANAVHFSVLQEYLAAILDVGVGRYYQFSNNYHVYQATLDMLDERDEGRRFVEDNRYGADPGDQMLIEPTPLVHDAALFDEELEFMLRTYDGICLGSQTPRAIEAWDPQTMNNRFLARTAWPMLMSHYWRRQKVPEACDAWLSVVEASDWRVAAAEWVERRKK